MSDDAASLLFQSDALRRVGGRPTRPPLLATRDALRSVLSGHRVVVSFDSDDRAVAVCSCGYQEVGGSPDAHRADAVLASGVVRDPATLADDEALVAFISVATPPSVDNREVRSVLTALPYALTEDPS